MLLDGAKIIKKKEEKPRITQIKNQLRQILTKIASNGQCSQYQWIPLRNYIIYCLRETLEKFQAKYKDSNTFDDQTQVILQYLVFFEKPPFTLQRIVELIVDTDRYYKSSRKLLYAFQKLVNVCDPEEN